MVLRTEFSVPLWLTYTWAGDVFIDFICASLPAESQGTGLVPLCCLSFTDDSEPKRRK